MKILYNIYIRHLIVCLINFKFCLTLFLDTLLRKLLNNAYVKFKLSLFVHKAKFYKKFSKFSKNNLIFSYCVFTYFS